MRIRILMWDSYYGGWIEASTIPEEVDSLKVSFKDGEAIVWFVPEKSGSSEDAKEPTEG